MTREEAILTLKYQHEYGQMESYVHEALGMAIEALGQEPEIKEAYNRGYKDGQEALAYHLELCREEAEPCDDAISRQAVLDLVADYDLSIGQVVRGIHALPPVTPKQKMGEWIIKPDLNPKCSECGKEPYYSNTIYNYKFCPYCGQPKMAESEET